MLGTHKLLPAAGPSCCCSSEMKAAGLLFLVRSLKGPFPTDEDKVWSWDETSPQWDVLFPQIILVLASCTSSGNKSRRDAGGERNVGDAAVLWTHVDNNKRIRTIYDPVLIELRSPHSR